MGKALDEFTISASIMAVLRSAVHGSCAVLQPKMVFNSVYLRSINQSQLREKGMKDYLCNKTS